MYNYHPLSMFVVCAYITTIDLGMQGKRDKRRVSLDMWIDMEAQENKK